MPLLPPRDPAHAQSAELVFPPSAQAAPPHGGPRESLRAACRPVVPVFPPAYRLGRRADHRADAVVARRLRQLRLAQLHHDGTRDRELRQPRPRPPLRDRSVPAAGNTRLVSRGRSRDHRSDPRAELPAGAQSPLATAAHELQLRSVPHRRDVRRVWLHHEGALRSGHRGNGGCGAHAADEVARVRVPGETRRRAPPAAAGRAVPLPARLAHVVRGTLVADVSRVVRAAAPQAPRGRPRGPAVARTRSFRGTAAAVRACPFLSLSIHDAEGAPRDGRVVVARARGRLRATDPAPHLPLDHSGRYGASSSILPTYSGRSFWPRICRIARISPM